MCGTGMKQNTENEGEHFCIIHLNYKLFCLEKKNSWYIYIYVLAVPGGSKVKIFSYREMRKATHDFSGANKIGEGGFGSVFRVIFIVGHFNQV